MTNIAGCIMAAGRECTPLIVVFARGEFIRIGVHSSSSSNMVPVELSLDHAKAFRRNLSRAIREAEDDSRPKQGSPEAARLGREEAS